MDHYATLGVYPNATNAELNNAFKRKNTNITRRHTVLREAEKERETLKESYSLLKNKGRRNEYNRTRKVANIVPNEDYKIISQQINPRSHLPGPPPEYVPLSPQQELDGIGKDLAAFSKAISEELKKGYSLIGTPFYSSSPHNIYQALVKDNKYLSQIIMLPVLVEDKVDTRVFPFITEHILKKGFRPYETPIRIRSTHHMEANKAFNFQAFIK